MPSLFGYRSIWNDSHLNFWTSELEEQKNKLTNGSQGLKDEFERLQRVKASKDDELRRLQEEQSRVEQKKTAAAISASTGDNVKDKKQYIGALQKAIEKKQKNLNALELSEKTYDVRSRRCKLSWLKCQILNLA